MNKNCLTYIIMVLYCFKHCEIGVQYAYEQWTSLNPFRSFDILNVPDLPYPKLNVFKLLDSAFKFFRCVLRWSGHLSWQSWRGMRFRQPLLAEPRPLFDEAIGKGTLITKDCTGNFLKLNSIKLKNQWFQEGWGV